MECVRLLLEHGADISARVHGSTAIDVARAAGQVAVQTMLDAEGRRQHNATAEAMLSRQAEAYSLADEALSTVLAARGAVDAFFAAASSPIASMRASDARSAIGLRDNACSLACHFLAHWGCAPNDCAADVTAWLRLNSTQELLLDLGEALPGRTAPDPRSTPMELALAVRVAQLRLREAASAALVRPLGQDELAPLLEQLIVVAQPTAAYSVLHRLRSLPDDELLLKPDVASAVDGWALACAGVQAQAMEAWRTATCRTEFWRALSSTPPPHALHIALCDQKRFEPLSVVFEGWMHNLAQHEAEEIWPRAMGVDDYGEAVRHFVNDLLPEGTIEAVAFEL